jgi:hypothetical protein
VGVHAAPAAHAPHVPLSQTSLAPHEVPLATLPVTLHKGRPVEQLVAPVSHGLGGEHVAPTVQAPHVPLSQTMLVPHDVPFATLPVESHTAVPLVQSTVPVWHGLVGEHAVPAPHATHVPPSQTSPDPQVVPLATLPVASHTGVPMEQVVAPVWHGLPVEHDVPATQAPQVPLSQTWPDPQAVPLATLPVALHTATPVEQLVVPVWHGLVGEHVEPAVHATHAPPSQTRFVPHDVPLATAWVVLLHTGTPVEHAMAPVTHGLGGVLHTAPAVQAEQTPLSHTALVPQAVPLATI